MWKELNWSTDIGSMKLERNWRLILGVVGASVAAFLMWHLLFPHAFWFKKLWSAGATGGTGGVLIGGWWQIRDPERRADTYALVLIGAFLAWGAFSVIALRELAPEMASNERAVADFKRLANAKIVTISATLPDGKKVRVTNADDMATFLCLMSRSDLFDRNRLSAGATFDLTLTQVDGTSVTCQAEFHHPDLLLQADGSFAPILPGPGSDAVVQIPGAGKWLMDLAAKQR